MNIDPKNFLSAPGSRDSGVKSGPAIPVRSAPIYNKNERFKEREWSVREGMIGLGDPQRRGNCNATCPATFDQLVSSRQMLWPDAQPSIHSIWVRIVWGIDKEKLFGCSFSTSGHCSWRAKGGG